MTDYFEYFVQREFPEGADREQRAALNSGIQELETSIFEFLPELLDCPEVVQDSFIKAVYDIKRRKRMN